MDILNELEIRFVVAPYEADAQMAFMVRDGQADFAISEDSDLIGYGCPRVVMKLTPVGGYQEFSFQHFYQYAPKQENDKGSEVEIATLQALNKRDFALVCVMAGCEYLPNIERVGLKFTLKHFRNHKTFEKVIEALRENKKYTERVPADYEEKANRAANLFQFQTVFCPKTNRLRQLEEKGAPLNDLEYLGPHEPFNGILADFTSGKLKKYSREKRQSYMGQSVIDMSKIRMDFARNQIDAATLQIIDKEFFNQESVRPVCGGEGLDIVKTEKPKL